MQIAYQQRGSIFLILIWSMLITMIVLMGGSHALQMEQIHRAHASMQVLATAKAALIGQAAISSAADAAGYLRLPDIGIGVGNSINEGNSAPNFSGNAKNFSVMGRFPWRTLGVPPLHDGDGECVWYALSGNFKSTPTADTLNWDTPGQLTLLDAHGGILAKQAAALLIAPGIRLPGQIRHQSEPEYEKCGGNYEAQNYLDNSIETAVLNYFPDTINHRVATTTEEKYFIASVSHQVNDQFMALGTEEIFQPLMHREAFATHIASLLDDSAFHSISISGTKGTDSINCLQLEIGNQAFCKNWKEMLLLVQPPNPVSIQLDGNLRQNCQRIVIFGGQRTNGQIRTSAADRTRPENYLEADNVLAFNSHGASGTFHGNSQFKAEQPATDLLRCLL